MNFIWKFLFYWILGCFKDGAYDRDLYYLMSDGYTLTEENCFEACRKGDYKYAGLQRGQYCFCSDTFGRYGTAGNCAWQCNGNNGQICGGAEANSVHDLMPGSTIGKLYI